MNQLEFPTAERKKFRVNMFFPESHSYPSHEIEADSSTKCSYISQAKLTSIKWSGELRYVDDGHDCEHKPAKRVALEFVVPPGRTIEVRFCLLETPKPVMVISTSEQLWKECEKQRPLAIAPTWLRRESKEQEAARRQMEAREEQRRLRELEALNAKDREQRPKPKSDAEDKKPNN